MNAVIDTSVAVAWYLNESFSQPAREWQHQILAGKVHAQPIFLPGFSIKIKPGQWLRFTRKLADIHGYLCIMPGDVSP